MRKFSAIILLPYLLAALTILTSPVDDTFAQTVVTTKSIEEFDKIMMDKNCRCMIVVMAAWCRPCRKELPVLEKLHEKYKDQGLSLIGVSVDPGGPEAIQSLITKSEVSFPVYWVGDDAVRHYKIFGIPMIFVIKKGQIIEKIPGERPASYLEKKIEALLQERD